MMENTSAKDDEVVKDTLINKSETQQKENEDISQSQDSLCPEFTQADSLRFRNELYEVVEELKLRRAMNMEGDEKIKQLVMEKHALQNSCDELRIRVCQLEDAQEEKLAAVRQEYTAKLQSLEERKVKAASMSECYEKEIKFLKDEIRKLQMSKYNQENKVKELEHKLHLQSSAKDGTITQVLQLGNNCKQLAKTQSQLILTQQRLEKEVKEAKHLNSKLCKVNSDQENTIKKETSVVFKLQHELHDLEQKLVKMPTEEKHAAIELRKQVTVLEHRLEEKEKHAEMSKNKISELESSKKELEDMLKSSHDLLSLHVDICTKNAEEAASTQRQIRELKEMNSSLQDRLQEKEVEDKERMQKFEEAESAWKTQEEKLMKEAEKLNSDLKNLTNAHAALEELNSGWSRQNVELQEQLRHLQAELNKPKEDKYTEMCVETATVGMQTVKSLPEVDQATQTSSIHTAEGATQTTNTQTTEGSAQTTSTQTTEGSTQTQHRGCAHVRVQTAQQYFNTSSTQTDETVMHDATTHLTDSQIKQNKNLTSSQDDETSKQMDMTSAVTDSQQERNDGGISSPEGSQGIPGSQETCPLSPYSRFAATLKSLASKSPRNTDTKSEGQPCGGLSVKAEVNKEGQPAGILQGPGTFRKRKGTRVHFAEKLTHGLTPPDPEPLTRGKQQKDVPQEEIDKPQEEDTVLFSDEEEGIELGSQVERKHKMLKVDRLQTGKRRKKQLQS